MSWPETSISAAIQLLEYSNSQLLEFRHYDELLTLQLASVYKVLEQGTGWFSRWRLAKVRQAPATQGREPRGASGAAIFEMMASPSLPSGAFMAADL